MSFRYRTRRPAYALIALGAAIAFGACVLPGDARADDVRRNNAPPKGKKSKRKKKKSDNASAKIRWGRRSSETDAEYDKRFSKLLKRVKQDSADDKSGGEIVDPSRKPIQLWTYMGHPFIVRTDIDREFTAHTAMYMEMLHREYSKAFKKVLAVPSSVKEKIEVIVYADGPTYLANGGMQGSGGSFMVTTSFQDREPSWPALHYRLSMFTNGERDFAKWEKTKLKHEAAHMEMRMRLGMKYEPRGGYATFVESPNWYEEGIGAVFEYWDFDKSVEENLQAIPTRGRYAPIVRQIYGTEDWKDFNFVWTITNAEWSQNMTSNRGFYNYCQAWSLAGYMMTSGKQGRKNFRAIYDLSKRVGIDREGKNLRAWDDEFPQRDRARLDEDWRKWVEKHVVPTGSDSKRKKPSGEDTGSNQESNRNDH